MHSFRLLRPTYTSAHGFSLLELMVTLAIAAILMSLAAPALQDVIIKGRMSSIGNQFTGNVLRARNESVSRNTCTVMCLSTNTGDAITTDAATPPNVTAGPQCANSGSDWQVGWIVFLKEDCIKGTQIINSRPPRPEDYLVIRPSIGSDYNLQAQTNGFNKIFFDSSGRPGLQGANEFDMSYMTTNSAVTQKYGFNICLDSVGRTRTISWSSTC